MVSIEQSVMVNAPVRTAYNQFMEGVESLRKLDENRLLWRANIGGKMKEWVAEIHEQQPGEGIAWTSRDGAYKGGVVTFRRLDNNRTKVMLQINYDPEGLIENIGDVIGIVSAVKYDLRHFKRFVESRYSDTWASCHEIERAQVKRDCIA